MADEFFKGLGLDEIIAAPKKELEPKALEPVKTYFESCPKCRGSGVTKWGPCFRCKGKGGKDYKTSPEQRKQRRVNAIRAAVIKGDNAWKAFAEEHPDVAAWIVRSGDSGYGFAMSMRDVVQRYGHLTERQLTACQNGLAREQEREAQRAKERQEQTATGVDVSRVRAMITKAQAAGLKRIAVTIGDFRFSPAPEHGANTGAIYVKIAGEYAGKIVGNDFIGRNTTEAQRNELLRVAADPMAAAKEHGIRTGRCSCCGATLTNAESIELGIGPICASKFF